MLGAAQLLATTWVGVGWVCPMAWATGWPCPGCGFTRAMLAGLKGQAAHMLQLHALAPVGLLLFVLFVLCAVAPEPWRQGVLGWVATWERRRLPLLMVVVALVYWGARLLVGTLPP